MFLNAVRYNIYSCIYLFDGADMLAKYRVGEKWALVCGCWITAVVETRKSL